jgi:hypothetical protein
MNFRALVDVAYVRSETGWTDSDYTDAEIQAMIDDVSMYVEALIGHAFPYATDTEYTFLGDGTDMIEFYGFSMRLAGAPTEVSGEAFSSSSYDLLPADGPPYESIVFRDGYWTEGKRVTIKGDWGWATVPDDMKKVAVRLIKRYANDEAWAGSISGSGTVNRDIKRVDIGEGRASVTFSDDVSAVGASFRSTGDVVADRVIRRYRRYRIGVTV